MPVQKRPEPHVFHLQTPPVNVSKEKPFADEPALPLTVDLPSLESARPLPKPVEKVNQSETKPMTHDQFVKDYAQPNPEQRARPPAFKKNPPVVPSIDISGIREDLSRNLSGINTNTQGRALSAVEQNRLRAFQNKIYDLLDQAWRKPQNFSGAQYAATVRFIVTMEGRILFQEFLKTSGSEIFDFYGPRRLFAGGNGGKPTLGRAGSNGADFSIDRIRPPFPGENRHEPFRK